MKKTWETPHMDIEQFTPNEAVSACYTAQCMIGQGNSSYAGRVFGKDGYFSNGEKPDDLHGDWHNDGLAHGDACGYNTVLSDDGTIYENGKGSTGYVTYQGDLGKHVGETIAWNTTDKNGSGVYYHFGTLGVKDTTHPTRS